MIFEMFFPFPVFLTVRAYLKTYFYEDYSVYSTFCGKLDLLEFFNYLATFRLFHVQNVEYWPIIKINQFCFLLQKAEMHTVALL